MHPDDGSEERLPLGGSIHHDTAPRRWVARAPQRRTGEAPQRRVGAVCPLAQRGTPDCCGGGLTSRWWYLTRWGYQRLGRTNRGEELEETSWSLEDRTVRVC